MVSLIALTASPSDAYGCSEMLFNPFSKWFSRGPINKLFRLFIWSHIPIHSKISTLAYISSYYAIACAFPLSSLNWILMGLFREYALTGNFSALTDWHATPTS